MDHLVTLLEEHPEVELHDTIKDDEENYSVSCIHIPELPTGLTLYLLPPVFSLSPSPSFSSLSPPFPLSLLSPPSPSFSSLSLPPPLFLFSLSPPPPPSLFSLSLSSPSFSTCISFLQSPDKPYKIHGNLLVFVERMDEEFTKLLQATDPHSTDFVTKYDRIVGDTIFTVALIHYTRTCSYSTFHASQFRYEYTHVYM